jgi:hypothetical protein
MTLDMIKPIKAHNIVEFTLEPQGGSTTVTWAMNGDMPYISKILSVFLNMAAWSAGTSKRVSQA